MKRTDAPSPSLPPPPPPPPRPPAGGPREPVAIEQGLAALRRQVRSALSVRGLSTVAVVVLALVLVTLGVDRLFRLSVVGRGTALVLCAAILGSLLWTRLLRPLFVPLPRHVLAGVLERHFPRLGDRLRSAVDFLRDPAFVRDARGGEDDLSAAMKRSVVTQATQALASLDPADVVDTPRVVASLTSAVAAIAFLGVLVGISPQTFETWFRRQILLDTVEWPFRTQLVVLGFESGSRAFPRGDPVPIQVRAKGELPARVSIHLDFGRDRARYNMTREEPAAGDREPGPAAADVDRAATDEDRAAAAMYAYRHPSAVEDFSFFVAGGDYRSPSYRVRVLERPQVEALEITLEPPSYTGRGPQRFASTVGELAVPAGSRLVLAGEATKPLRRATVFAEDKEAELALVPGAPRRFTGAVEPRSGGVVRIHLEDLEDVPPESDFQFAVHVVDDKAPVVKVQALGVGTMLTSRARLPLAIDAEDDYRVDSLVLAWSLSGDDGGQADGEEKLPPLDKQEAKVHSEPAWEISQLQITPEKRITLRVGAADNDGIAGAKTGYSGALTFRVVTDTTLIEDLLRREEELRRALERIIEEEKAVRDRAFERLRSPGPALPGGDPAALSWLAAGELPAAAVAELREQEKTERNHIRQLRVLARGVRQILDEMRNNRVGEADDLARLASLVVTPIDELAATDLPELEASLGRVRSGESPLRRQAGAERDAEKLRLVNLFELKLEKLDRVLSNMLRLEGFTEIVKRLRSIISTQRESRAATEREYRQALDQLFLPEGEPADGGGKPR